MINLQVCIVFGLLSLVSAAPNGRIHPAKITFDESDAKCGMVIYGNHYNENDQVGLDFPHDAFIPYHVVSNEEDFLQHVHYTNSKSDNIAYSNYWLVNSGKTGDEATFYVAYTCPQNIRGFKLKNTHHHTSNNAGTKDFTISIADSLDGPWSPPVLSGTLPDARNVSPVPVLNFELKKPVTTSFLRFQIDSHYGLAGGLQHFSTY